MEKDRKSWRVEWIYCVLDGVRYTHHRDYKTEKGANKAKSLFETKGFKTEVFRIPIENSYTKD